MSPYQQLQKPLCIHPMKKRERSVRQGVWGLSRYMILTKENTFLMHTLLYKKKHRLHSRTCICHPTSIMYSWSSATDKQCYKWTVPPLHTCIYLIWKCGIWNTLSFRKRKSTWILISMQCNHFYPWMKTRRYAQQTVRMSTTFPVIFPSPKAWQNNCYFLNLV